MDRIEHIAELQEKSYKTTKKQSVVINNFFSLITIIIISITIILYVNYVVPAQKERKQKELQLQKQKEYSELRAKQIALSHKLNQKKESEKGDEK
ncbi:MAG: hypothetical protein U9Q20_01605 [Campylobacterota bacterium]|nr:hypothetical protein [Campylobacterota bacterium]